MWGMAAWFHIMECFYGAWPKNMLLLYLGPCINCLFAKNECCQFATSYCTHNVWKTVWLSSITRVWRDDLNTLGWQFGRIEKMSKISFFVVTPAKSCWTVDCRAFRTSESESESADFSEVRGLGLWKPFRLGLGLSCLRIYTVKKLTFYKKNPKISFFSFLKSYYSLYKPHAQISTIVKTS
jgi:hypothetical protein